MNKLNKFLSPSRVVLCFSLLLSSCGGGDGSSEGSLPAPSAQPHDPASMLLTESNTRFAMANAQAIQHVFRFWINQALTTARSVTPEKTTNGYLCGGGGRVDVRYSDLDGNKNVSEGDQIVSESPLCHITPVGGGRTQFTIMSANLLGIVDARVKAEGTVETWALEAYGWAHKMTGTMRFLYSDPETILVLSEGDIELALHTGQTLKLRNLAVTYKARANSIAGQFDLVFNTGREAGTSVQVDTVGELRAGGANVGPQPGALQLSGLGNTKARLEGRFVNGIGGRFRTLVDFSGKGQLSELDDVSDQVFYSWFVQ